MENINAAKAAFEAETCRAYGKLTITAAEYRAAMDADWALDIAIEAQFGSPNRWKHTRKDYNAATLAAYNAKIAADLALHNAMNRR